MTSVRLIKDGGLYKVTADGHAATSIMCASVSTLLHTLATSLDLIGAKVYEREIEPGHVRLVFGGDGADTLMLFTATGFKQLEKADENSVKIAECRLVLRKKV